ncbi:hypothetical protein OH76DRAFT_1482949 [Lentinus brumalis]|uniref:Uncharacterized protein n=1 Tax=Lentinus brumalis TaxID=2498619 RepID=A0A371DAM9_9APHY|nr:hypothetical protein OH76DRAFT_1482949 [Polyporus brumalis]
MKTATSKLILAAGVFIAQAMAIPANAVPRPQYATTITTVIAGHPTTITATIDPFPTGSPAVVTLHADYVTTETVTVGGHPTTLTLTVDAPITETITTTIGGKPTTLTTTIFPFGAPTPLP